VAEQDTETGQDAGTQQAIEASAKPKPKRALRGLALFFIGGGINHFLIPRTYESIVPPGFGDPKRLVEISGVAEIAGGVGMLLRPTRGASGIGMIALMAAVFPANLYMARNPERFPKIPQGALYARLPLQPLLMWWVWRVTRPS
jgi:uncharacterized membrane protein